MGQDRFQVLVTRIGNVQRIFPLGTRVRVGRDPQLELVSTNPLVSRECHGVITSDATGATYTDMSRRGTYLDAKSCGGHCGYESWCSASAIEPLAEGWGSTPPLTSTEIDHDRAAAGPCAAGFRMIAAAVVTVAGRRRASRPFFLPARDLQRPAGPPPLAGPVFP